MKNVFVASLAFLLFSGLQAQDLVLISSAGSYSQQGYYKLSNDNSSNVDNTAWDIAFTTIGQQDAGILINESSRTSFGTPQPDVICYQAPTNNWDDPIVADSLVNRLYNDEVTWTYGGAFNQPRDKNDLFDFGWGKYNFMANQVNGSTVYVVRLRDGSYKKFQVQSLILTKYTFRYADLDGANEVTVVLDKADYENSNFAYFSFASNSFITAIQDEWDMVFCRYITPIEDNTGTFIPFPVTGILTNFGVQVAQANGVDPETVDYATYEDSLSSEIEIIGWDWKIFDNAWILPTDLVYFVKTVDGQVWKIRFLQFDGSSSGDAIFEKTLLTTLSTANLKGAFQSLMAAPNPASGSTSLVFDLDRTVPNLQVVLSDMQGKQLRIYNTRGEAGINALTLNDLPTTPGLYLVQLNDGKTTSSIKLMVQ